MTCCECRWWTSEIDSTIRGICVLAREFSIDYFSRADAAACEPVCALQQAEQLGICAIEAGMKLAKELSKEQNKFRVLTADETKRVILAQFEKLKPNEGG